MSKSTVSSIGIKRFSNVFTSDAHFHVMTEDFGESNTDKSFYRPDISSVRALAGSAGASNRVGLYDFDDGKDTGETIQTVLRSKGLDPTEIDAIEAHIKADIDAKKELDEQSVAKKMREMENKEFNDYIKKISESPAVSGVAPKSSE